jgi:hypothetical protein
MKPRHAAALALIGWYLTCPPVVAQGWERGLEAHRYVQRAANGGLSHAFEADRIVPRFRGFHAICKDSRERLQQLWRHKYRISLRAGIPRCPSPSGPSP